MAEQILMPKQGNTVETCVLSQWKKQVGDQLTTGDILCEIETDKSTIDVEATAGGTILALLYEDGDDVPVQQPIAIVGEEGEDIAILLQEIGTASSNDDAPSQDSTDTSELNQTPNQEENNGSVVSSTTTDDSTTHPAVASPSTLAPSQSVAFSPSSVALSPVSSNNAPSSRATLQNQGTMFTGAPAGTAGAYAEGAHIDISPRAKRLAVQERIMYTRIQGTGPRGRIIERDIISAIAQGTFREGAQSSAMSSVFTLYTSANMNILNSLVPTINTLAQHTDASITGGDLILCSIARTLSQFPQFNARIEGGTLQSIEEIHLGYELEVGDEEYEVIIYDASSLTVAGIAQALIDMKHTIQNNGDLVFSHPHTFKIENLFHRDIEYATAMVPAEYPAVLGLGNGGEKPVRNAKGEIVYVPHISLSLTVNEHYCDRSYASKFLQQLRCNIEHIDIMYLR